MLELAEANRKGGKYSKERTVPRRHKKEREAKSERRKVKA
jgi:hypothetical protein